jgi:hypothetical protein
MSLLAELRCVREQACQTGRAVCWEGRNSLWRRANIPAAIPADTCQKWKIGLCEVPNSSEMRRFQSGPINRLGGSRSALQRDAGSISR